VIRILRHVSLLFLTFPLLASAQDSAYTPREIGEDCFRLGAAAAFSEMVRFGVKKLALSTAVTPEEMSALEGELRRTIAEQGVQAYLETDLIVTDLFPEDIATGKHLMLIYTGDTLEEYLALKEKKDNLVRSGKYSGQARQDIAREFGRLLSYPESTIEEKTG
jgi:hypothetical protein